MAAPSAIRTMRPRRYHGVRLVEHVARLVQRVVGEVLDRVGGVARPVHHAVVEVVDDPAGHAAADDAAHHAADHGSDAGADHRADRGPAGGAPPCAERRRPADRDGLGGDPPRALGAVKVRIALVGEVLPTPAVTSAAAAPPRPSHFARVAHCARAASSATSRAGSHTPRRM
jgi:hypothetical protein